jgi:hypothetical protein
VLGIEGNDAELLQLGRSAPRFPFQLSVFSVSAFALSLSHANLQTSMHFFLTEFRRLMSKSSN